MCENSAPINTKQLILYKEAMMKIAPKNLEQVKDLKQAESAFKEYCKRFYKELSKERQTQTKEAENGKNKSN